MRTQDKVISVIYPVDPWVSEKPVFKIDRSLPSESFRSMYSQSQCPLWEVQGSLTTHGGNPHLILKSILESFLEELTFSLSPKILVKLAQQSFGGRIKVSQAEGRAYMQIQYGEIHVSLRNQKAIWYS